MIKVYALLFSANPYHEYLRHVLLCINCFMNRNVQICSNCGQLCSGTLASIYPILWSKRFSSKQEIDEFIHKH